MGCLGAFFLKFSPPTYCSRKEKNKRTRGNNFSKNFTLNGFFLTIAEGVYNKKKTLGQVGFFWELKAVFG